MALGAPKIVDAQLKEALISLTTLAYIDEHALLTQQQLRDAKQSLQALFLRTSGEETMLRKLIAVLKTTRSINKAFSDISKILSGISRGAETLEQKLSALRQAADRMKITAEENSHFVGPFLEFSGQFRERIAALHRGMEVYIGLKENEAKCTNMYRIAQEARTRLKERLSGALGAEARSELEARIKEEVFQTFDYGEAGNKLKEAKRRSKSMENEIGQVLSELREMCQMVMNPDMRERGAQSGAEGKSAYADIYALARSGLKSHSRLQQIKDIVLELFRLYQHSYGMFRLDFENLNRAIEPMLANADAYFKSKEEDEDIRVKREKLQKIEALIPFVEHTAEALADKDTRKYAKFSRKFSDIICQSKSPWESIGADLLRMKVFAEAELSARM